MVKLDVPGAVTMMRKTPILPSEAQQAHDIVSDEQKIDASGQKFEDAANHIYNNTGGPEIFNNDFVGLNQQYLDNVDP